MQLAQLRRGQFVVEDDQVGVGFGRGVRQHVDLAAAEKRRRIRFRTILQDAQHHARARGFGEAAELFKRMFGVDPPRAAGHEADERGPLYQHWTACTHLRSILTCHV